MRIVIGLCLALVLVAATPSESSAQEVAQEFTLKVSPGQMPAFLTGMAEITIAAQRLGTATGDLNVWQNTVGGPVDELVIIIITVVLNSDPES